MTYFYSLIFLIIWIANFLNGTGIGNAYQTTEIFKKVIIFLGIVNFLIDYNKKRSFKVDRKVFYSYFLMFSFFLISSFLNGYIQRTLDFIWIYILVYLISKIPVKYKILKVVGTWYVSLGMIVLFLFNYTSIFSGWNGNTIGMIAMYSYLFYLLKGFETKSLKTILFVLGLTSVYSVMLLSTDSRSSILFSIIGLLYSMGILSDKMIKRKDSLLFFLILPFLIAVSCILISKMPYLFDSLNEWSLKSFKKPIFNGRNDLWFEGLNILFKNIFLGCGNILRANWHNSAIHVLATYGLLGYFTWICSFYSILKKSIYTNNKLLKSTVLMFLLMYVHQSVELGFVSTNPNMLPYVMFGLILSILKREKRINNG